MTTNIPNWIAFARGGGMARHPSRRFTLKEDPVPAES